jgi:hypothetical protein
VWVLSWVVCATSRVVFICMYNFVRVNYLFPINGMWHIWQVSLVAYVKGSFRHIRILMFVPSQKNVNVIAVTKEC